MSKHGCARSLSGSCATGPLRTARYLAPGDSTDLRCGSRPRSDGRPRGQRDLGSGFRAMTTSMAFRWGTPPELETNSLCPESRISQSQ